MAFIRFALLLFWPSALWSLYIATIMISDGQENGTLIMLILIIFPISFIIASVSALNYSSKTKEALASKNKFILLLFWPTVLLSIFMLLPILLWDSGKDLTSMLQITIWVIFPISFILAFGSLMGRKSKQKEILPLNGNIEKEKAPN